MKPLLLAAGLVLVALLLYAVVGHGLVNYDTLYALDWGRDLGHGRLPDYAVSVAPTPHPLATLIGLLLTPLSSRSRHGITGDGAAQAAVALAFLSLAVLGWVVFRLGQAWFNTPAGVLAAVIVLTRQPVLDFGARAYVDIPYVALVLGALLVETRRPRAGAPVLGLLAMAGLLRPEAWLFSGAYVVWLAWSPSHRADRGRLLGLVALAASAPLLWLAADLAVTGNPLHSLTGTRSTARVLGRVTGLQHVPATAPRRLGEILREPVLFGAAVGAILSLAWLHRRAWLGAVTGVLSLIAFSILATAGLSILGRYLLLPAAILAIFCGAGAFGWMLVPRGNRRRRRWRLAGAAVAVALVAFIPAQVHRISALRTTLAQQARIQTDLASLVRRGSIGAACQPIAVPNHRPVPLLALWLDVAPRDVISAQERTPTRGSYVTPANRQVADAYILDRRDPVKVVAGVPDGFAPAGGDASWRVFRSCGV